ncbi:MAG: ABC transporter ATP-binding protein [Thermofilaceae archaeon]
MSGVALHVLNLSKRFGNIVALDKVSFEVREGEYFAIIGPSGSGKSTLLKCIAGLERPDNGKVYIFGRLVNDLPPEKREIGLIFQEIYLFPHMTVKSNVLYPAVVKGVKSAEDTAREILSSMGIELRAASLPSELSLGDQQKVALARALASGARLLLLDEPFGSMDPRTAERLRYEVRRVAKSLGLTVIHVTHNQEEAMAIADRIAVMRRGRIEQIGSPLELYLRPNSLFVARFIGGENNFLVGKVVEASGDFAVLDIGSAVLKGRGSVTSGLAVLTIRPEKLRFANDGRIEGVVDMREFLGKTYKYVIRLNGGVSLIVRSREKIEVGASVRLTFNPEDALVFPYPKEGLEEAVRYE